MIHIQFHYYLRQSVIRRVVNRALAVNVLRVVHMGSQVTKILSIACEFTHQSYQPCKDCAQAATISQHQLLFHYPVLWEQSRKRHKLLILGSGVICASQKTRSVDLNYLEGTPFPFTFSFQDCSTTYTY